MKHSWKDYKEDWLLFTEAGFIAVNQADEDSALKLFRAGALLNPDHVLPQIGFGYLHLHKLELKQAVKAFEDILKKEPANEMVKTFLGLCLGLMPEKITQGEKILMETSHSADEKIKDLSNTAIEFIDTFVKQTPGPAGKK